jgi:surface antigen
MIGTVYYLNTDEAKIGKKIDSFKGVPVYYNGINNKESHGGHYSADGYYYGEKWQCVEFAKRFYYDAKGHKMPDVMGNAKDFFDPAVPHGKINTRRGLIQYRNGGDDKPQIDDLLVFTDSDYGHVAIVSKVSTDFIEVIQQNAQLYSRQKYQLKNTDSHYYVGTNKQPAGWLRTEKDWHIIQITTPFGK